MAVSHSGILEYFSGQGTHYYYFSFVEHVFHPKLLCASQPPSLNPEWGSFYSKLGQAPLTVLYYESFKNLSASWLSYGGPPLILQNSSSRRRLWLRCKSPAGNFFFPGIGNTIWHTCHYYLVPEHFTSPKGNSVPSKQSLPIPSSLLPRATIYLLLSL